MNKLSPKQGYRLLAALSIVAVVGLGAGNRASFAHTIHSAPKFTIRNLGTLHGGFDAEAFAINNAGEVTGQSSVVVRSGHSNTVTTHAFLYHSGRMTDLGSPPGALASYAHGINASGLMVGAVRTRSRGEKAYVARSTNGHVEWEPLPGIDGRPANGMAAAVNDSGAIAGTTSGRAPAKWNRGKGRYHLHKLKASRSGQAFAVNSRGDVAGSTTSKTVQAEVWLGSGKVVRLPGLGGRHSEATAIVDPSDSLIRVAGSSFDQSGRNHAVVWTLNRHGNRWIAGRPKLLGTLSGYRHSEAYGINRAGWVVGIAFNKTAFTAFLWRSGKMTRLRSLVHASGWQLTWASGINDHNQVIGWGSFHGRERPFVLTPR